MVISDIAHHREKRRSDDLIRNWLRNRNTIEFLGIWERLNSFTLTPKQWIEKTNAIGIISRAGRYGGTFAHKDIAFEFASWVSVEFKLYLNKEFQRLKAQEQKSLDWNVKRSLTKINYRIHTDAIKSHLVPEHLSKQKITLV